MLKGARAAMGKLALVSRFSRPEPAESLRAISAELAAQGHLNERGKPFAAKSIASMLAG